MANITLCDIEEMRRSELLGPAIERCLEHRAPDPGYFAVMGHNPGLALTNYKAWTNVFNGGAISHRAKEVIRVLLSRIAHCSY
ncbi:MAG: hypothetical protein AB7N54_10475 [Alphaproteobacteria bacterium]